MHAVGQRVVEKELRGELAQRQSVGIGADYIRYISKSKFCF